MVLILNVVDKAVVEVVLGEEVVEVVVSPGVVPMTTLSATTLSLWTRVSLVSGVKVGSYQPKWARDWLARWLTFRARLSRRDSSS